MAHSCIDKGADVNAKNKDGFSCLGLAIINSGWDSCDPELIKLLLEKGADVNHVQDSSELTPLTAFLSMQTSETDAEKNYPEATLISHTDETGKVTTGKLSQLVRYLVEGNFIEAENFIRTENLLEHLNSQFLFEYDYTINGKVRHSSDTSSLLGHLLKQDIYRTLNIADHGQIIDRQIQIIDFLFHIDPKLNLNNHRSGSDSDTPLYHALFNSPYFETIVPILLEKGADPFQTLSTSGSTHKSFNLFHHIFNHCKAEQINNMGGMTGYRYLSLFGDFVRE